MEEIKLTGGRSTEGVVRIGETVRRPHKETSDFANAVLLFLEQNRFPYSPKYLGSDEKGRDMYTYIPGFVPEEIGETTLPQLLEFIKMIRTFHDISTGFTGDTEKVLCHNDLSSCNTVFLKKKPIGIIDWDSVAYGERWEDITYILWLWINIGSHTRNTEKILRQIQQALYFYGPDKSLQNDFPDKLIWRMHKVLDTMDQTNRQYPRTKEWVEFSTLWVQDNRHKITEIIV